MKVDPYKRIPLEILFISAVLGIFLASRIYLFVNTDRGLSEIIITSVLALILTFTFKRYFFPLSLAVSTVSFLLLINIKENVPSDEITLKGYVERFSENSFILKDGRVSILVHSDSDTDGTFAVVRCSPKKMDINNPFERAMFFRGITAKCSPKYPVLFAKRNDFISRLRENLIKSVPDTIEGSILKAITLGERKSIPEHINRMFIRTGTAHLLAISGIHFGTIVTFIFMIMRKLLSRIKMFAVRYNPYTIPSIISFPLIFTYLLINLNSVSAIRSFIMTIIFTLSLISLEKFDLLNIAGASGFLILSLNPFLLFSPSFQLSFSAIHFIIFCIDGIGRARVKIENPILRRFLQLLVITFFAGAGTLPAIASTFGYITPKGIVGNLLSVPLFTVLIIPLSFTYILLIKLPFLNFLLWTASRYSIKVMLLAIQAIDRWEVSMLFPPAMPFLYFTAFYVLPFALHIRKENLLKQIICVSLLSLIPISLALYPLTPQRGCVKISGVENVIYVKPSSLIVLNLQEKDVYKILELIKQNRLRNLKLIYISGNEKAKIRFTRKILETFYIEEVHSIDGEERFIVENMCNPSPSFKNGLPLLNEGS